MDVSALTAQYPFIKLGMRGERVVFVQKALNTHGYQINADGVFGIETYNAVIDFQKNKGLVQDGIVGSKTLLLLNKQQPFKPLLTQADLVWASNILGVELAAVMAVNFVESKGSGFLKHDNRAVILFERHIMRRRMLLNQVPLEPWATTRPDIVNSKPGGYLGGVSEYTKLESASLIHRPSALESASWGAYQIMGFHWKHLNYNSVVHYTTLMDRSERDQLEAFVRFIKADPRLHNALKDKAWTTFASIYNGPGYAKHKVPYDVRLEHAYNEFTKRS